MGKSTNYINGYKWPFELSSYFCFRVYQRVPDGIHGIRYWKDQARFIWCFCYKASVSPPSPRQFRQGMPLLATACWRPKVEIGGVFDTYRDWTSKGVDIPCFNIGIIMSPMMLGYQRNPEMPCQCIHLISREKLPNMISTRLNSRKCQQISGILITIFLVTTNRVVALPASRKHREAPEPNLASGVCNTYTIRVDPQKKNG